MGDDKKDVSGAYHKSQKIQTDYLHYFNKTLFLKFFNKHIITLF